MPSSALLQSVLIVSFINCIINSTQYRFAKPAYLQDNRKIGTVHRNAQVGLFQQTLNACIRTSRDLSLQDHSNIYFTI
jgi:hypothetical protein